VQLIVPEMAYSVCRMSIKLYTHSLTLALLVQFSQCRDLLNVSTNQSFPYTQCQACIYIGRPGNTSVDKIKTT